MGIKISDKDRELLKEGKVTIEQLFEQSQKEIKEQIESQKEIDKLDAQLEQVGIEYVEAKHRWLQTKADFQTAQKEKRELKKQMLELRKRRAKLKNANRANTN